MSWHKLSFLSISQSRSFNLSINLNQSTISILKLSSLLTLYDRSKAKLVGVFFGRLLVGSLVEKLRGLLRMTRSFQGASSGSQRTHCPQSASGYPNSKRRQRKNSQQINRCLTTSISPLVQTTCRHWLPYVESKSCHSQRVVNKLRVVSRLDKTR